MSRVWAVADSCARVEDGNVEFLGFAVRDSGFGFQNPGTIHC